eukprot:TRINITY_DN8487_c1_g1_i2.p1 TRINITY_DN8487_c1_g1~~TRINITY_DN8487_c1_g1_i2.p1  ORF type:complete len:798 (-),score=115.71 TRINITY_DN8487_c1_g1_i2:130-2523(-)
MPRCSVPLFAQCESTESVPSAIDMEVPVETESRMGSPICSRDLISTGGRQRAGTSCPMPEVEEKRWTGKDFEKRAHEDERCSTRMDSDTARRLRSLAKDSLQENEPNDPENRPQNSKLFVDAQAMKEKVRQSLIRPKYNVTSFYTTYGVWQKIARHNLFESVTLCIIACNAIWIAYDTDSNGAEVLIDSRPVFQLAENLFCAFFSLELFVRYQSFKRKRNVLRDAWFVFDTCMVMLMILETWVLSVIMLASTQAAAGDKPGIGNAGILRIARLMRLSRMARMARLLRAMPELMILIKGMLAACRSVFFTLCLLGLIMFVFGIAFTQLAKEHTIGDTHFQTVPESMYTLLVRGTLLDDVGNVVTECRKTGWVLTSLFFFYVLLATLTVMNMLIGVLCEVVSAVATTEREEMLVSYVGCKLKAVVELLDTDLGGTISRKEFLEILQNVDAIKALQEVGVDVVGLVDFADFIFGVDCDNDDAGIELSLSQFMEVVLQLRGSNTATVKDIVDLRKFIRTSFADTQVQISSLHADMKTTHHTISKVLLQTTEIPTSSTENTPAKVPASNVVCGPCEQKMNGLTDEKSSAPLRGSDRLDASRLEACDVGALSTNLRGRWSPLELPSVLAKKASARVGDGSNGHQLQTSCSDVVNECDISLEEANTFMRAAVSAPVHQQMALRRLSPKHSSLSGDSSDDGQPPQPPTAASIGEKATEASLERISSQGKLCEKNSSCGDDGISRACIVSSSALMNQDSCCGENGVAVDTNVSLVDPGTELSEENRCRTDPSVTAGLSGNGAMVEL